MARTRSTAPRLVRTDLARLPVQLVSPSPRAAAGLGGPPETAVLQLPARAVILRTTLSRGEVEMDLAFEKVRPLVIYVGEQVLVGIVLAFHVTVFALLTIPESISSPASLGGLAWDQLSSPGPHAPAGDLSLRLFKIWTSHVFDVELARFRNLAARIDRKLASSLSSFARRSGFLTRPGSTPAHVPMFFLRPDRGPSFLLCATFGSERNTSAEPRRIARPRDLSRPPDGLHCCSNQACTQSGSVDETLPCAGFPRPIRPRPRRWVRPNGLRAVSHTG